MLFLRNLFFALVVVALVVLGGVVSFQMVVDPSSPQLMTQVLDRFSLTSELKEVDFQALKEAPVKQMETLEFSTGTDVPVSTFEAEVSEKTAQTIPVLQELIRPSPNEEPDACIPLKEDYALAVEAMLAALLKLQTQGCQNISQSVMGRGLRPSQGMVGERLTSLSGAQGFGVPPQPVVEDIASPRVTGDPTVNVEAKEPGE